MNARKLSRRGLAAAGLATLGVVAASGVAYAYWGAQATDVPVYSTADTMNAGSRPTASANGTSVDLTWTAVTTQGGRAVTGYVVKRYDAPSGGNLASVANGTCASTVSTLSCTETDVPDGTWYYTTTPVLGAWLGAESARSAGATVVSDAVVPTVTSIVRADASPSNGSSVSWTVLFSEPVTGVDATDFVLAATGVPGTSITSVTPVDASTYTVTAGTGSGSGEGTVRLDLVDNDSIADLAGNKLGGPGVNGSAGGGTYTIDRQAPTVSSVNRSGTSPTNAAGVTWNVQFAEDVTGVNAADFSLVATGTAASSGLSVTPASPSSYTVTANDVAGNGTLTLHLVDDDSIADLAGNKLGGTGAGNGNAAGQTYSVDRTVPTVTSINRSAATPTNASSLVWRVTFSEDVTGVNAGDFAVAATGTASGATPVVTPVDASRYDVSVGSVTGTGTLGLNLTDDDTVADLLGNKLGGTGNGNGNATGQIYGVDRDAPAVSSIGRAAASPTNASGVSWTVTFSESVTGVDLGDFELAPSGVSGASLSGISGSGTTYTVSAATGTGSGAIGLNLVDNDSIADTIGNKLGGIGNGNGNLVGQSYAVDKGVPSGVGASAINGGTAGKIDAGDKIVFTFSEAMRAGSIMSGWTGASAAVTVNVEDANAATNDTLAVVGTNLGVVNLGNSGWVTQDNPNNDVAGTMVLSADGTTVTVTLSATPNKAGGSVSASTFTWTPSASATDAAGNPMPTTTVSNTSQRF